MYIYHSFFELSGTYFCDNEHSIVGVGVGVLVLEEEN